jgi:hypothetical protein
MTTSDRALLLEAIGELSRRYPDWRLGQLVANVAGWADQEIWDVEDERLLAAVRSHLRDASGDSGTAAQPVGAVVENGGR